MKIKVTFAPSCIWVLEDESFVCTHDAIEIEKLSRDYMDISGPCQEETDCYVCAECGEILEGYPAEDREEALAEYSEQEE